MRLRLVALMASIAVAGAAWADDLDAPARPSGRSRGKATASRKLDNAPAVPDATPLPPRPPIDSLPPPVPEGFAAPAGSAPVPALAASARPASVAASAVAPARAPEAASAPVEDRMTEAPVASSAQGAPQDSTRHRHLGGFIRPDLGFGFMTTFASQNGNDVAISGLAGTFGLAAGFALSENSILALHFWDSVATNPEVSVNGSTSSTSDTTLTLLAFGPEYTYYTGGNYYFSFSPALTRATLSSGGSAGDTNLGIGLRLAVGKEWWASDHWGLGLAGHLSMSSNVDSSTNGPTWNTWSATIAFSATYN